ncbi:failed axon connections-like [Liolophura sinensis]|uniref:failed axon connections-like n=1 Tax=Liolophura sinensis TaxID=3198878 RepID=UPI0031594E04
MLEENTLFTYAWYRILFQPAEFWGLFSEENKGVLAKKTLKYGPILMKRAAKVKFWQQGVSRLSPAEIYSLAETDLKALSDYLGTKDYFLGKEPTLLDCVAFGHLIQILWLKLNFPPRFYAVKECKNLLRFLDRMRDRFYPDWEQLCKPSSSS